MGSVIDYIDCPDCGSECHNEFFYKTGEEDIFCTKCGYSRSFYITNWGEKETSGDAEWTPDYKLEEEHGCGAYRIRQKGAIAYECGAFVGPESVEEFLRLIEEKKDELVHAEYTLFQDGVLTSKTVIDEGPAEVFNDIT